MTRFAAILKTLPWAVFLAPLVRVRLVPARLGLPEKGEEERVLRHGLQGRRDLILSARRAVVVQAAGEHVGDVRLGGQQSGRQEAGRETSSGSRPAGLGNAPAQDFAEPRVDPARAFDLGEILTVPGFLGAGRAGLAELLPDAPDPLRFRLEGQLDERIVASGPWDVRLATSRRVREQQRQTDRVREGRFAEVVGAIENVEPRAERDVQLRDRGKAPDTQTVEPHRASPSEPSCCWSSL